MKTTNRNINGSGVAHLHITRETPRAVRPIFLKLLVVVVALAAITGVWHGN